MVEVGECLFVFQVESFNRVVVDIVIDDWFEKLKVVGFEVYLFIVWILEGLLYYLQDVCVMEILKFIVQNCMNEIVVLVDFMNELFIYLVYELKIYFYFYSDWFEEFFFNLGFF